MLTGVLKYNENEIQFLKTNLRASKLPVDEKRDLYNFSRNFYFI